MPVFFKVVQTDTVAGDSPRDLVENGGHKSNLKLKLEVKKQPQGMMTLMATGNEGNNFFFPFQGLHDIERS